MPRQVLVADLHLVAVVRNHGELVGKVLGIEGGPHVGVRKDRVAAVRLVDRLQQQPALKEAVRVRRLGDRCGRCEVRRKRPGSIVGGAGRTSRGVPGRARLCQTISRGPDCCQREDNQCSFHILLPPYFDPALAEKRSGGWDRSRSRHTSGKASLKQNCFRTSRSPRTGVVHLSPSQDNCMCSGKELL